MVLFGVADIIGGLFVGYLVDKIGSKKTCLFNTGFMVITACSTLYSIHLNELNAFSYLMCFIWGFNDAI
jgi:predicted MFS family arabinose efflux permease